MSVPRRLGDADLPLACIFCTRSISSISRPIGNVLECRPSGTALYRAVQNDDAESRAFLIAHELIEQYGDDVADYLQAQIDAAMDSGDHHKVSAWFIIRNAVTLTLKTESKKLH